MEPRVSECIPAREKGDSELVRACGGPENDKKQLRTGKPDLGHRDCDSRFCCH